MDGDFKGDFTRDTFDPTKHFSRVLMQQGRVQLDADWNEQADILLNYLRTLATHIIGQHGGPDESFMITKLGASNFNITPGYYYVDGILVENKDSDDNPKAYTYQTQPFHPQLEDLDLEDSAKLPVLVYLDVWERHVTYLEHSSIREVALGVNAPDTATRAEVVWQVKVIGKEDLGVMKLNSLVSQLDEIAGAAQDKPNTEAQKTFADWLQQITQHLTDTLSKKRGHLAATTQKEPAKNTDPCITPPNARYRGAENRLYRVEIHKGSGKDGNEKATFKWSRENGAVVFPILQPLEPNSSAHKVEVQLEGLGRDDRFSLKKDDWVEVVDDNYLLRITGDPDAEVRPLLRVESVDPMNMTVTLVADGGAPKLSKSIGQALLRRWDHNVVEIEKGEPLPLEEGIYVQFEEHKSDTALYRPGDYWLIPARVATGDIVDWPTTVVAQDNKLKYTFKEAQGVKHHYAPLAIIWDGQPNPIDLRYKIKAAGVPAILG